MLLVSILAATIYNAGIQINPDQPVFSELKTFSSYEELENFINTNMEKANQNEKLYAFDALEGAQRGSLAALDAQNTAPEAAAEGSTTNIQVAGVDEADIVKTD